MTTALENERHEVLRGVPPRRVRLLLVVDVFRTYTHAHILSRRNQEKPKPPPKKTVGPTEDILDMHTYTQTRTYKAPKSKYVRMQKSVKMGKA